MKSVYLAGPLVGLNVSAATSWREYATEVLRQNRIEAYSPLRGEEFDLTGPDEMIPAAPERYDGVAVHPDVVFIRDRYDVMHRDAMLLNLQGASDTGRVSIGSMIEIGWADAFRKPVVIVMDEDNPHWDHPFIHAATPFIVDNLEDALTLVISILKPRPRGSDADEFYARSPYMFVPRDRSNAPGSNAGVLKPDYTGSAVPCAEDHRGPGERRNWGSGVSGDSGELR